MITIGSIDGGEVRTLSTPAGLQAHTPVWSPDGSKLVYQLRDGSDDTDVGNFFVEDLATGQVTQITDLDAELLWWWMPPSFSPDGQTLVYHLARDRESEIFDVWTVPVTGGESTLLLENAMFPSYLPSGEIVFAKSEGAGHPVLIGHPNGDQRTLVDTEEAWFPHASPDGTRVVYAELGRIYVVDVATGQISSLVDGTEAAWLDDDTLIVNGW